MCYRLEIRRYGTYSNTVCRELIARAESMSRTKIWQGCDRLTFAVSDCAPYI